MDTINFKALETELHDELVRVKRWRRVVRVLSVVVYSLVFCWFMFVLFGGMLLARLGWEDYGMLTHTLIPVFIGLVVLSFLLSRSMASFRRQEAVAVRRVMQALVPQVGFSLSSEADSELLGAAACSRCRSATRGWAWRLTARSNRPTAGCMWPTWPSPTDGSIVGSIIP